MSLEKILLPLREMLIEARKHQDTVSLQELSIVFTVLEEVAVKEKYPRDLIVVLSDLGYAARDQTKKTEWSNIIPTEERLRAVSEL